MTRKLYDITGTDRTTFLQGLITNDMAKAKDGLLYAALLTPQGKFLSDFFLLDQGDHILLDAPEVTAEDLIRRLTMFKLRADVQIAPSNTQVKRGTGTTPDNALPDPRHAALGWRLYGAEAGDDGTDWDALRVTHCIPETGIELIPNETYILEAGFERLNGVDFRKGCYVGQEIIARMKHKTTLKKGYVTVDIDGTAPVGTPITANGKPAGTLFTQADGQAIAYLRFDRAKGELQAGDATITPPT
ncbi:YgfZ/GcvT domain-containing protein [Profundibacter sp.]|uniref:CAF17-like 4Fe-4S cluster assembly/insertion protein YgfZ n=1 Tax=Profundibacter sp. TaxID=3101071 RepID=UPI003D0E802E